MWHTIKCLEARRCYVIFSHPKHRLMLIFPMLDAILPLDDFILSTRAVCNKVFSLRCYKSGEFKVFCLTCEILAVYCNSVIFNSVYSFCLYFYYLRRLFIAVYMPICKANWIIDFRGFEIQKPPNYYHVETAFQRTFSNFMVLSLNWRFLSFSSLLFLTVLFSLSYRFTIPVQRDKIIAGCFHFGFHPSPTTSNMHSNRLLFA